MTRPIARDPIYRKRGTKVAHSTILRWVIRYVPEFEKRWNRFSKAVGTYWRVDGRVHVVRDCCYNNCRR